MLTDLLKMDACHFLPVRLGLWCLQREKEKPCCTSGLHGGATVLPSWCVSLPLLQASFLLSRWPNLRIYHCSLTTKTCFQGARFKSLGSTSDELYPPLEHYSLVLPSCSWKLHCIYPRAWIVSISICFFSRISTSNSKIFRIHL